MGSDFTRDFWDETPDAIIAISPDGDVLHWNRGAEMIFGWSVEEATGRPLADLVLPLDQEHEEHEVLVAAMLQEVAVYETIRRRKNGSLLNVSVSTKAVRDASGELQYFLATKKDITHLKAQRTAKLVEARYRGLLETTPDAIVLSNVTGRVVLANSQAEDLFGYGRGEMSGLPVEALLPERVRADHLRDRAGFFSVPRSRALGAGLEVVVVRKDGTEFPAEVSLSLLETDEGNLLISALRDISSRKRADQKFRDLLESAPDAMVIVDPTGRMVLTNSQTVHLFGWSREELLGQAVEMLIPERFRGVHPTHRTAFFGAPRARAMGVGLDLYGLRKNGSEFPVEISLSPLETEEGLFVSSAIRDVTERKLVERAVQEASRLKSEFLASMSHELRTPLNAVIGFSEFLIDERPGPLNAKQKEYIHDILQSGRHLLELINDVLDLSKVEAGRMDLFPERFSLAEAIGEVCSILSPLATNKNIALNREVAGDLGEVTLDKQRLKQILYNLLSNALKFTDEGGRVEISAVPQDEGWFRLAVHDTGIGISAENMGKLFIEFQQLDQGFSRRYQGTGLGLALTKKLVELQGGTISVESEPGQGSTFTVTLPVTP
jgi:protein-histidine pros-kinase